MAGVDEGGRALRSAEHAQDLTQRAAQERVLEAPQPSHSGPAQDSGAVSAFARELAARGAREADAAWQVVRRAPIHGGEDDGDGTAPPPPPPPPDPPGEARHLPLRQRAEAIGLDGLLAAARHSDLLATYQVQRAPDFVRALRRREFRVLSEALAPVAGEPRRGLLVLGAALAHRRPSSWRPFARWLAELPPSILDELPPHEVPLPGVPLRTVRRAYDPQLSLGWVTAADHDLPPAPPPPRWVRGLPLAPLQLASVALCAALDEELSDGETTGHGASAALTAAWAPHARRHPSLERWLIRLSAAALDREGLLRALAGLWAASGGDYR